jgi:hypothetical protein
LAKTRVSRASEVKIVGWKSGNVALRPLLFVAKTRTECTQHFCPFFVNRMRHLVGVFSNFNEKSQILCPKFGLYDFFFTFATFKVIRSLIYILGIAR